MSKKISAKIGCPQCGNSFVVELYRSIWIEDPVNRDLIFTDKINMAKCPKCGRTEKLKFPFLCTNVKKGIAIWYEPYADPDIEKDVELYAQQFGPNHFYSMAPRIRDWEEFKTRLQDIEMRVSRLTRGVPSEAQEQPARTTQSTDRIEAIALSSMHESVFSKSGGRKKMVPKKIIDWLFPGNEPEYSPLAAFSQKTIGWPPKTADFSIKIVKAAIEGKNR